jgi:hypothetical protein
VILSCRSSTICIPMQRNFPSALLKRWTIAWLWIMEELRWVRHKHEIHTLSVIMPQSMALESVSRAASTRRVAIRRHASATVVVSGIVRALDNFSLFTVRSPGDLEFTKKNSQQLLPPFLLHRFQEQIYSLRNPLESNAKTAIDYKIGSKELDSESLNFLGWFRLQRREDCDYKERQSEEQNLHDTTWLSRWCSNAFKSLLLLLLLCGRRTVLRRRLSLHDGSSLSSLAIHSVISAFSLPFIPVTINRSTGRHNPLLLFSASGSHCLLLSLSHTYFSNFSASCTARKKLPKN